MKSKQQNKICGYLLQSIYIYTHQNYVSNNEIFPLELPSLGSPKSHHHDPKPIRIKN